MRISDWSSDVCSSDLSVPRRRVSVSVTQASAPACVTMTTRTPPLLLSPRWIKIGRASCRERVCQYVYISVVAVSLKKKQTTTCETKQYHKVSARMTQNTLKKTQSEE